MKVIGAILVGVLMIVVGMPLYTLGDVEAGAWLAGTGVLAVVVAAIAGELFGWRRDPTRR